MSLLIGFVVLMARALAPSMMVILIASAFWSIVSAGIYVLGFSMVREMFTREKAGVYLGLIATMMSIGMLLGPIVGGIIMQSPIGWRGLNVIIAILMAVAMVMIFMGVHVKKEDVAEMATAGGSIDFVGTLGMMMFLGGLIIVLSMTSFIPFGSVPNTALLVVAVVGLVILVVDIVKKADAALIPRKIFKDPTSLILALVILIGNFAVMGLMYYLPQYIPTLTANDPIVAVIDPGHSGLSLLLPQACSAVAGLFLGPIFGRMIAKKCNAKNVIIIGTIVQMAVVAAFYALFVGVMGKDASGIPVVPFWAMLVLMLFASIYNARNQTVGSAGVQIQVRPDIRVQANSIVQVGQNLGAGLAVPIFGAIQAAFAAPMIASGMNPSLAGIAALPEAMPVLMIVSFVPLIVMLLVAFLLKPLPKEEQA
jgi:MFS family permease